jgi:hypothetical protein
MVPMVTCIFAAVFHVDAHYDEKKAAYVLLSTQDDIFGLLDE